VVATPAAAVATGPAADVSIGYSEGADSITSARTPSAVRAFGSCASTGSVLRNADP
jgi:coenzyme F420-reducing hydrogenase gamma subunit